jgi:hypothetical protein
MQPAKTLLPSPYLVLAEEDKSFFGIYIDLPDFETPEEADASFDTFDWFERPELGRQCVLAHAAVELRKTLCQMIQVDECGPENFPWMNAPDEMENAFVFDCGDEDSDGFQIRASKSDNGQSIHIYGESAPGTAYAVYHLLELLGCRWTGLGDRMEDIPWMSRLQLKQMTVIEKPSFRIRAFWPDPFTFEPSGQRGHYELFKWMARHRINFWHVDEAAATPGVMKQYGFKLTAGADGLKIKSRAGVTSAGVGVTALAGSDDVQTDESGITADESGVPALSGSDDEQSPESNEDEHAAGQTRLKPLLQLQHPLLQQGCTSNNEAVDYFTSALLDRLANDERWRHADYYSLRGQIDGAWCDCAACEALGTPTERLLKLAERCSRELDAATKDGRLNRKVGLRVILENETLVPPPRVSTELIESVTFELHIENRCHAHTLNEECEEFNQPIRETLKRWHELLGENASICMGDGHNGILSRDLPVLHSRTMPEDLAWYYKLGIREVHSRHIPRHLWGPLALNHFQFASLTWRIEQESERIKSRYFRTCYGAAHKEAALLYSILEQALSNISAWKTDFTKHLKDGDENLFPTTHLPYRGMDTAPPSVEKTMGLLLDLSRQLGELLEKAETGEPVIQSRIMQEDLPLIEYAQNTLFLYETMSRAVAATDSDIAQLKEEVAGWAGCLNEQVFDQTGLGIESPLGWKTGLEASLIEDFCRAWLEKHGVELVDESEEEEDEDDQALPSTINH